MFVTILILAVVVSGGYLASFCVGAGKKTEEDIQIELEREREWWMGSL